MYVHTLRIYIHAHITFIHTQTYIHTYLIHTLHTCTHMHARTEPNPLTYVSRAASGECWQLEATDYMSSMQC